MKMLSTAMTLLAVASPCLAQQAAIGDWGIGTENLSTTVEPGDDFYRYVNQGWLETAEIPAGFPFNVAGITSLLETERQLEAINAYIVAEPAPANHTERNIKALFLSYTDVERLNELGLEPIRGRLEAALSPASHGDVARLMGLPEYKSIIGAGVVLDPGDPQHYAVTVLQSGLTLPSRDYYLAEPFAPLRDVFESYVEATLQRGGIDEASEHAAAILALETDIARASWPPTDIRDKVRMHHPMTMAELADFAPGFDWDAYLGARGYDGEETVIVSTDTAVQALAGLFARTPVETWRAWLAFHYLDQWSEALSEEWQEAHFAFHQGALAGVGERRPLAPRAVEFISDLYGEELGRLYVERYFPAENRERLQEMIDYMRAAFRARIEHLDWMDEPTRAEALVKLEKLTTPSTTRATAPTATARSGTGGPPRPAPSSTGAPPGSSSSTTGIRRCQA